MKPKNNYIPPKQFKQILEAIPKLNSRKYSNKDIEMLFKICYWVGLRINEAAKLKVENIDLDEREIFLGKTKTKKNDYRVIPEPLILELDDYLQGKSGYLFPNLSRITVWYWLKKLGRELNIKAWTAPQDDTEEKTVTHGFRKSIGKDMYFGTHGNKADLFTISKQLGHSNVLMTIRYLKLDNEAVKEYWAKDQLDFGD